LVFYKIIAALRSNRFHKMRFCCGSPACGLLPIPSKLNSHSRTSISIPFLKIKKWVGFKNNQSNKKTSKQANKQTNNPAKTHEHR
jgi:hypothetical protein